jgi:hypothetical protein
VVQETKPFNSLSEMAKQVDSYKWGTIGGSLWEELFMVKHSITIGCVKASSSWIQIYIY